ncbi:leucyl/phenylalanyl-tRNA--protein transferase [Sphingomonas sp. C3-2]|uniref:leucyl/phenylalanyl-tRNA--protein transferase n=1 Tax=Sphingomonas sp. C3-2 TaxID=3062169 RepID=UPI00294B2145|nr:leucyl/phenylalanyl-tRNA--protein transferase [Sphingomonas sp. C3-2]WOK37377.1 leucyl/phenylalanyl-tRNA--protein transferase [Sphingomonas sp. C3-2]
MQPLDTTMLLRAYACGVFPMADDRDADKVFWVEPKKRGVLPLDGFHLSRSLAKTIKSDRFIVTADRAFREVIATCAQETSDRPGTWINAQIESACVELHARGHAHSVEVWHEDALVGGLYGIKLGGAFFGESMFSRMRDASKVALAHLVARLRLGGFTLLDCQFITDHLASLGAIEIPRDDYIALLDSALVGGSGVASSPDFSALDSLAAEALRGADDAASETTVSGPVSGKFIVQALAHTS